MTTPHIIIVCMLVFAILLRIGGKVQIKHCFDVEDELIGIGMCAISWVVIIVAFLYAIFDLGRYFPAV